MMKNYYGIATRVALALPMIIFGLNKFLLFADMPPPQGQQAQMFLGAMFSSYLAKVVGATEIVSGLLLLNKRTSFMGALLLVPITFNIAAFHFSHDLPGNGLWLITSALHGLVLFQMKDSFQKMFAL